MKIIINRNSLFESLNSICNSKLWERFRKHESEHLLDLIIDLLANERFSRIIESNDELKSIIALVSKVDINSEKGVSLLLEIHKKLIRILNLTPENKEFKYFIDTSIEIAKTIKYSTLILKIIREFNFQFFKVITLVKKGLFLKKLRGRSPNALAFS